MTIEIQSPFHQALICQLFFRRQWPTSCKIFRWFLKASWSLHGLDIGFEERSFNIHRSRAHTGQQPLHIFSLRLLGDVMDPL